MKQLTYLTALVLLISTLSACQLWRRGNNGVGNGHGAGGVHCPPGQAKKGTCGKCPPDQAKKGNCL